MAQALYIADNTVILHMSSGAEVPWWRRYIDGLSSVPVLLNPEQRHSTKHLLIAADIAAAQAIYYNPIDNYAP